MVLPLKQAYGTGKFRDPADRNVDRNVCATRFFTPQLPAGLALAAGCWTT